MLLIRYLVLFCAVWACHSLGIDRAGVRFFNNATVPLAVSGISADCYHCVQPLLFTVKPRTISPYFVDVHTAFDFDMTFVFNGTRTMAFSYGFGEHGQYTLVLNYDLKTQPRVRIVVDQEPTYPYAALWTAVGLFVAAAILWQLAKYLFARWRERRTGVSVNEDHPYVAVSASAGAAEEKKQEHAKEQKPSAKAGVTRSGGERLKSLDVFRGLCLAIMIFVDAGPGKYIIFGHATWNGLYLADIVFPWFMWIMGTTMAMAFYKLRSKGTSRKEMLLKTIRRTVILIGLGLFINNGATPDRWRIPGVLQRFGVSYLGVSLILIFCPHREIKASSQDDSCVKTHTRDVTNHVLEWIVVGFLVFIHSCFTFLMPFDNCPAGYLGPGGIGDYGKYKDCGGGAAKHIDLQIFGKDHIWGGPPIYRTGSFDPEGLLGCLTCIATVYLGAQAGRILLYYKDHTSRIAHWLAWAVILGIPALALSGGTRDGGLVPINKAIWSISFVLAMGSLGNVMLALMYALVDWFQLWHGAPFYYAGLNSIVIYFGMEILHPYFPFTYAIDQTVVTTHGPYLTRGLVSVCCWLLIAYYMFAIDFFVAI